MKNPKYSLPTVLCATVILLAALHLFFNFCLSSKLDSIRWDLEVQMTVMILVLFLPPMTNWLRGKFDYFEISTIYLLVFFLNYFLPALFFCNNPVKTGTWYTIDFMILPRALAYTNISICAFLAGYFFPFRTRKPVGTLPPRDHFDPRRVHHVMIFFSLAYIGILIIQNLVLGPQTTRGFNYNYGYGIFEPFLNLGAIVPLLYYIFYWSQKRRNLLLLGLSIFFFIWGFKAASRGAILIPIALIIIARHYLVKKITIREILALAMLIIATIIYIGIYRFQSFKAFDLNFIFSRTEAELKSAFSGLEFFLVVLMKVPKFIPFFGGQCLVEEFYLPLLPRIIFPTKPPVYGYFLFWDKQFDLLGSNSTYYLSMPGQLYMDFGVPGILIGSLLVGLLFRAVARWFGTNRNDYRGKVFIYTLALVYIIRSTPLGGIPFTYEFMSTMLLPILAIGYIYHKFPRVRCLGRFEEKTSQT